MHPLRAVPTGVARSLDGRVDGVPHGSITFDSLREYVVGDEMRRVHWRTSARVGELMVREHVDTSLPRLVVLLDDRAAAHPAARGGIAETFEAACEAAASVVTAALREELPVTLLEVVAGGTELPSPLDRLAATELTRPRATARCARYSAGCAATASATPSSSSPAPVARPTSVTSARCAAAYPSLLVGLFGAAGGSAGGAAGLHGARSGRRRRVRRRVGRGAPMVKLWRPLTAALVLVALLGLAATVLARVYAGPLLTRLLLGAAIASVGISLATRRLPSWLVAPLSVLGLAAYTAFALQVAARHAELPGGLAEVTLDAARNGIPRLLTAMIPVQAAPDTVLVPLVATWLAGLAGAEVTLRTGRVLLGYLPPVLLYGGALYVVGPNADPALWPTTAFIAAAALGLVLPGRRGATPAGPAAGTLGTGGCLPPYVCGWRPGPQPGSWRSSPPACSSGRTWQGRSPGARWTPAGTSSPRRWSRSTRAR